ncbi:hypothetical protein ACGFJ7_18510 [Actinoplanes sp. NPDC048988]|uniref:hypothetical protein n=1 Tax=Actinoplanes sp. NPDC048988 TaxID=3363901 RepID=UPI00371B9284
MRRSRVVEVRRLQAALAERERTLSADHPRTVRSRIELAGAYRSTPEYDDPGHAVWEDAAIGELAKAAESRARTLGPEHPDTLTVREELALVRWGAEGDREPRLIAELESIAAARARILGEAHPDTLETLSRLEFWSSPGPVRSALRKRILRGWREAAAGPDDIGTLRARARLAALHRRFGDEGAARALFGQVAAACERIVADRARDLGPVHPDTVAAREEHARYVRWPAGPDEERHRKRGIAGDLERLLGPDDPRTLRALIRLAAETPPDEGLLARAHAVLGRDDEDVALLRAHLVVAYAVRGREDEALALVARYPVAADDDVLDQPVRPF